MSHHDVNATAVTEAEVDRSQREKQVQTKQKKRASKTPKRIDQCWTAVATYYGTEANLSFKGMRGAIVEILQQVNESLTAAEVMVYLRRFGFDKPESTVHGQLHALFHLDIVSDKDTPDRRCRYSSRVKKTWRLLTPVERNQIIAQRKHDAEGIIGLIMV
jgi:Fe2+ or Zn2+ uptake regulation protein